MAEDLQHFKDNCYVVLWGALSPKDVTAIKGGMDAHEAAHP